MQPRPLRTTIRTPEEPRNVKLFISYPSDQKELAERLRLALEAEGHEVFTDRAELKEGEPYHAALREAIEASDALVFLITPRSIRPDRDDSTIVAALPCGRSIL